MESSRRNFINRSLLGTLGLTAGLGSVISASESIIPGNLPGNLPFGLEDQPFTISVFSKCLHWMGYNDMATAMADMGFDGIDLTVRPDGHVVPERVEEDLPAAVNAAHKAGIQVSMMTTAITDAEDPLTERILKTAGSLGIRHYRMGWYFYDEKLSVEESLRKAEGKLRKLATLNKKYSISGEYQNHSGAGGNGIYMGGAIWDMAGLLKKINSEWIGFQYDIYHATVEGTNTWPAGMRNIAPYIRTLDIKNFRYIEKEGKWGHESVPLDQGLVDYKKFFGMVQKLNIRCPLSLHYEYPLGGAEKGSKTSTMKKEDMLEIIARDLKTLKSWLKESGLK
jgi:L-ribulose-5-phosphate 3-epimerase